jgi:hypothetical protein
MGNTRRATGAVPAAFARDGVPVPPSPDVAEASLANVIGEAVALHLAQVAGPLLEHIATTQYRPACLVCAVSAKRADRDHQIAVANARTAAEPEPERPDAPVTESFTEGARGPVCWAHFDPDRDGILDLDDYLPPPVD